MIKLLITDIQELNPSEWNDLQAGLFFIGYTWIGSGRKYIPIKEEHVFIYSDNVGSYNDLLLATNPDSLISMRKSFDDLGLRWEMYRARNFVDEYRKALLDSSQQKLEKFKKEFLELSEKEKEKEKERESSKKFDEFVNGNFHKLPTDWGKTIPTVDAKPGFCLGESLLNDPFGGYMEDKEKRREAEKEWYIEGLQSPSPHLHVKVDKSESANGLSMKYSWETDDDQIEKPKLNIINKLKTMFRKITKTLKRALNEDLQDQYRVGFRDSDLELSESGKDALLDILAVEKEVELAERARELIAEEEKENDDL